MDFRLKKGRTIYTVWNQKFSEKSRVMEFWENLLHNKLDISIRMNFKENLSKLELKVYQRQKRH